MPGRLFARLEALASRRILGALIVIFLVLFLVVFPMAAAQLASYSGDVRMIDSLYSYTPDQVYQMISAYGEQGRSLYILTTLTADLLYPLDYSLLLSLLIIATYRQAFPGGRMVRPMSLLPFITALFDLLENAGVVAMLASFPQQLTLIAQASSIFTSLKWGFLVISIVLVLVGFIGLAAARLRPH